MAKKAPPRRRAGSVVDRLKEISDKIDDLSTGLKRNDNRESEKIDRIVRICFGIGLLLLTVLFTATLCTIIMLAGFRKWETFKVAITALMIATPIQFVVLLCVIASCVLPRREKAPAPGDASQGEDAK